MTPTLRPLCEDDLATMQGWFADGDTQRWLGGLDWPEQTLRLANGDDRHALLAQVDGVPIALIDLERYPDRRASFAIAVDPAQRRRGVGYSVVAAMLRHPALAGIDETFAGVEAGNAASERLMLKCGFVAATEVDHEGFRYFVRPRPVGPWQRPD